jgi:hypothetical protein
MLGIQTFRIPMYDFAVAAIAAFLSLSGANAQDSACSKVLKPPYSSPVVGSGWIAQLIATDLTKPRGIIWDDNAHLLVVQQGVGIQRLRFNDNGTTCLGLADSNSVIENPNVNCSVCLGKI